MRIDDWNFDFASAVSIVKAEARWGYLYSVTRDVTAEAEWRSSAPEIAAFILPGHLKSISPGDAEVSVTYRDVRVTKSVRVFPGEPPLYIIDVGEVISRVEDASRPWPNNGVEGATVEIVGGHNIGRTAITDGHGSYKFLPPFVCGPVTARATKSGYREAISSSTMCMDGMPNLTMTPAE